MQNDTAPAWDGVPLNPERDGWHWLQWPHLERKPMCVQYFAPQKDKWPLGPRWMMEYESIVSRHHYLGPCLTPQEVAAREAAAFAAGAEAMRAACVAAAGELEDGMAVWLDGPDIADELSALPLPPMPGQPQGGAGDAG